MGLILFGVFILLLIIGVPVAFSICTAAGVTVLSGLGQGKLLILIQRMFEALVKNASRRRAPFSLSLICLGDASRNATRRILCKPSTFRLFWIELSELSDFLIFLKKCLTYYTNYVIL